MARMRVLFLSNYKFGILADLGLYFTLYYLIVLLLEVGLIFFKIKKYLNIINIFLIEKNFQPCKV